MSYTINLKVKDGKVEIASYGGDGLPDGSFQIDGHSDRYNLRISIDQRDMHGRYTTSAQHYHYRQSEGPVPSDGPLTEEMIAKEREWAKLTSPLGTPEEQGVAPARELIDTGVEMPDGRGGVSSRERIIPPEDLDY